MVLLRIHSRELVKKILEAMRPLERSSSGYLVVLMCISIDSPRSHACRHRRRGDPTRSLAAIHAMPYQLALSQADQ